MKRFSSVVCGMSGGVDSAVAAMLLKKKGFNVTGVFMQNWDLTNELGNCTAQADQEDAEYVCCQLDIPFHTVNFVKEYWNEVFGELMADYQNGLTPNPDVLCNKCIKFGHFFDHVTTTFGADAVATGHYAGNTWGNFLEHYGKSSGCRLLRGKDPHKDQTLFLSQISQPSLQRTMFPLGNLKKYQVKEIAKQAKLDRIVQKRESTGICFIGKRNFQNFIDEYMEPRPGNFVDMETGQVVGRHKGVHYWTYGQRTNLGGLDKAYFVQDLLPDTQQILVVKGTDHPALLSRNVTTGPAHWIHKPPDSLISSGSVHCQFRYQHAHEPIDCILTIDHSQTCALESGLLHVELSLPLRSIARGQYAVFYQGEECLGSAKILAVGPSLYHLVKERDTDKMAQL